LGDISDMIRSESYRTSRKSFLKYKYTKKVCFQIKVLMHRSAFHGKASENDVGYGINTARGWYQLECYRTNQSLMRIDWTRKNCCEEHFQARRSLAGVSLSPELVRDGGWRGVMEVVSAEPSVHRPCTQALFHATTWDMLNATKRKSPSRQEEWSKNVNWKIKCSTEYCK
jgi:hypothetical protein